MLQVCRAESMFPMKDPLTWWAGSHFLSLSHLSYPRVPDVLGVEELCAVEDWNFWSGESKDIHQNTMWEVPEKINTTRRISFEAARRLFALIPTKNGVSVKEAIKQLYRFLWGVIQQPRLIDELVPVWLHFHLSRDRMALAGARKAKALAWKSGNLNERSRIFVTSFNSHIITWQRNICARKGDVFMENQQLPALSLTVVIVEYRAHATLASHYSHLFDNHSLSGMECESHPGSLPSPSLWLGNIMAANQ